MYKPYVFDLLFQCIDICFVDAAGAVDTARNLIDVGRNVTEFYVVFAYEGVVDIVHFSFNDECAKEGRKTPFSGVLVLQIEDVFSSSLT